MGVSTDAILVYGYDLGDDPFRNEDDNYTDEDIHPDDVLLSKLVGFNETWSEDNKGYFDRKSDAEGEMVVELVRHCSDDYPMYILAARGSETRAYRGSPVVIENLDVNPNWDYNLKHAAKILGIEGSPQWFLVSDWG